MPKLSQNGATVKNYGGLPVGFCCVSDFRDKEVVNICDGERLGFVMDVQFDVCDGRIIAIIVPGERNWLGFGRCDDIFIPWEKIRRVGEDIILVEISIEECCKCAEECRPEKHKRKKGFF